MNDERLKALYAEVLARRDPGDRAACGPAEQLVALVERRGPDEARLATLDHAMACPRCRAELELLRGIAEAEARHRRWVRPALAAAASIAVIALSGTVLVRVLGRPATGPDVLRGPGDTIVLAAPAAAAATAWPTALAWHPPQPGLTYRVEILGPDGAVAWSGTTADTTVVPPPTVALVPGTTYRWWVRTTLPDGSEAAATPRTLTIQLR
jgi:hypothetical protein